MIERRVELSTKMHEGSGVDYDQETIRLRDKSLQFLREAILLASRGNDCPSPCSEEVIQKIERHVFERMSKKLLNARYKRIIRKVVFALRHNETFRSEIFSKKPSTICDIIEDLVNGKFNLQ